MEDELTGFRDGGPSGSEGTEYVETEESFGGVAPSEASAAYFRGTALLIAAISRYVPQLLNSDVMDHLPPKTQARLSVASEPYAVVEDIFLLASQRPRLPLRLAIIEFVKSIPELETTFGKASEIWRAKNKERDVLLRLSYLGLRYQNQELDQRLAPAKDAICTSDEDRFPRCLKGTRTSVIDGVLDALVAPNPPSQPFVLTGGAGTGKSAIAASLVHAIKQRQVPVCSFICSHDALSRRKADYIPRTLARQICRNLRARAAIEAELADFDDLEGGALSMSQQLDLLLAPKEPVRDLEDRPTVLLIDALDECDDDNGLKRLLRGFSDHTQRLCTLYRIIVVTRRTDPLNAQLLPHCQVAVDLDDRLSSPETSHAISAFIGHSLAEIRERQQAPDDWPAQKDIDALNVRAAGVFVWAQVAMRFIDGDDYEGLLEDVLSDQDDTMVLFTLYNRTLTRALTGNDPNIGPRKKQRWLDTYRSIVGTVLFSSAPCAVEVIAELANVTLQQTKKHLEGLRPLLRPFGEPGQPVQLLHASVARFLQDEEAGDFCLDPLQRHRLLALRTLDILRVGRRFNLADIDPSTPFEQSSNHATIRASIQPYESYAAMHWCHHVEGLGRALPQEIVDAILDFFDGSFLHWLEVYVIVDSVFGAARVLSDLATDVLKQGSPEVSRAGMNRQVIDRATDASRLVSFFADGVASSPAQIYLSGLPFAKNCSALARHYLSKLPFEALPQIISGADAIWPEEALVLTDPRGFAIAEFAYNATSVAAVTAAGTTYRSLENGQTIRQELFSARSPRFVDPGTIFSRHFAMAKRTHDTALPPLFLYLVNSDEAFDRRVWPLPPGTTHITIAGDRSKFAFISGDKYAVVERDSLSVEGERNKPPVGPSSFRMSVSHGAPLHRALALSHDGSLSAHALEACLEIHGPSPERSCSIPLHQFAVDIIAFAGRSDLLALGCSDHVVRVWDPFGAPDHEKHRLAGHSARITAIAASPKDLLASGSRDGTVRVWSLADGACHFMFRHVPGLIESLVFSQDGSKLLARTNAPSIRCWDVRANAQVVVVQPAPSAPSKFLTRIAVAPDGTRIALAFDDDSLSVRDCTKEGADEVRVHESIGKTVNTLQWSSDSRSLAVSTSEGAVLLWSPEQHADSSQFQTEISDARLSFSGNLRRIVAVGHVDGNATRAGYEGTAQKGRKDCGHACVASIAVDGSLFAASVEEGDAPFISHFVEVRLFDDDALVRRFALSAPAAALTLSNDGTALCVAGCTGEIDLFGITSHRHVRLGTLEYSSALTASVRFTGPDGMLLLTGRDGSATLCDLGSVHDRMTVSPMIVEDGPSWIRPACSRGPPIWIPAQSHRHRGMLFDANDVGEVARTVCLATRDGRLTILRTRSADPWKDFCRKLDRLDSAFEKQSLIAGSVRDTSDGPPLVYSLTPVKDGTLAFEQSDTATSPKSATRPREVLLARPGYASSTFRARFVEAHSDDIDSVVWFFTEPLSQAMVDSTVSVQLSTLGKDQGWADFPQAGCWSWYSIRVLDRFGGEKQKWTFRSNQFLSNIYNTTSTPLVDLRRHLISQDRIEVAVCARFPGWQCDALAGTLHFWVKADAESHVVRIVDEGLPLWLTLDPAGETDPTHVIKTNERFGLAARSSHEARRLWFRSEALDMKTAASTSRIRLETWSKDQGWAGAEAGGGFSWFVIAVEDMNGNIKFQRESHRNAVASADFVLRRGPEINIAGEIQCGDHLAVYGAARYQGWECHGRSATLHIWSKREE